LYLHLYFIEVLGNDHEAEFHEIEIAIFHEIEIAIFHKIKIRIFHEIKITIMRSKFKKALLANFDLMKKGTLR